VVCFGMPFYAGWGVTQDRVVCSRRIKQRSTQEIFYAAYILYTTYYNPYKKKKSDIFDTMQTLVKLRDTQGKKRVLVIGDSHIRIFEHKFFKYFLSEYLFIVVYIPGATAYGIHNTKSKTNAYNKFIEALEKKDYDEIIVCLGEVDTSFSLWRLAFKRKEDINDILFTSIQRYKDFLQKLVKYAPVMVLSAPLSTIADTQKCDDSISGIRKQVDVSQSRRIKLTLKFNFQIKQFVYTQKDIKFIDFTPYVLDVKNMKVKFWILDKKNFCNHHYCHWLYTLLVIWKLKFKN
jgi:hypothetical protein